jgi:hypothetical protein
VDCIQPHHLLWTMTVLQRLSHQQHVVLLQLPHLPQLVQLVLLLLLLCQERA